MISDFHGQWCRYWSYFSVMTQCRVGYNAEVWDSYCLHLQGFNYLQHVGNATLPMPYHQPKNTEKISYKFVHNHKWNGNKITKPHEVWVDEFNVDYYNKFNKTWLVFGALLLAGRHKEMITLEVSWFLT